MPRPKNLEEKARISHIAFRLLVEKGLNETSYTDIAEAADITKSMAQYYFPSKEDLMELFLQECYEQVRQIVESNPYFQERSAFENYYAVLYVQYAFLFANPKVELLCEDIMNSRVYTENFIKRSVRWLYEHIDLSDPVFAGTVEGAVEFSLGGIFNYIWYAKREKRHISARELSDKGLRVIELLAGLDFGMPDVPQQLTDEWVYGCVDKLNAYFFQ